MERAAASHPLPAFEPNDSKPLVFLDTNVIVGYLEGDPWAADLFSAEANGRIRLAVNAIVLQELLLASNVAERPEFERIRDHLRVLPVDLAKAEALLPIARALKHDLPHSNDILIVSSADECDFLVTRDVPRLNGLITAEKPKLLTPEGFASYLQAA